MKDSVSEYTLLIVESPTIANRLRDIVPDYVYVFSTSGFLWKPIYNYKNGRLGRKAIQDKLEFRNELRREARYAVHIIVATDSDPSGDFIAWTIHKEFPSKSIKRTHISSLSYSSVLHRLKKAFTIDFSTLFIRLQNRYRIRHLWSEAYPEISMKDAGLLAVFGGELALKTFLSDREVQYFSETSITVTLISTQISARQSSETGWIISSPLSTFDVISRLKRSTGLKTFSGAQALTQRTFETIHPETGEGLITYPRTEARSFYSDTWQDLQNEWIKEKSLNEFLPEQLHTLTKPDKPHDSIRPLHLDVLPAWVESHLPAEIGQAYKIIYFHTLKSIRLPVACSTVYKWGDEDLRFMTRSSIQCSKINLRPFLSVSELGYQLCKLGVLRPSGFGNFIDRAIKENTISMNPSGEVIPNAGIKNRLHNGSKFSIILKKLRDAADDTELSDETIRRILTS